MVYISSTHIQSSCYTCFTLAGHQSPNDSTSPLLWKMMSRAHSYEVAIYLRFVFIQILNKNSSRALKCSFYTSVCRRHTTPVPHICVLYSDVVLVFVSYIQILCKSVYFWTSNSIFYIFVLNL